MRKNTVEYIQKFFSHRTKQENYTMVWRLAMTLWRGFPSAYKEAENTLQLVLFSMYFLDYPLQLLFRLSDRKTENDDGEEHALHKWPQAINNGLYQWIKDKLPDYAMSINFLTLGIIGAQILEAGAAGKIYEITDAEFFALLGSIGLLATANLAVEERKQLKKLVEHCQTEEKPEETEVLLSDFSRFTKDALQSMPPIDKALKARLLSWETINFSALGFSFIRKIFSYLTETDPDTVFYWALSGCLVFGVTVISSFVLSEKAWCNLQVVSPELKDDEELKDSVKKGQLIVVSPDSTGDEISLIYKEDENDPEPRALDPDSDDQLIQSINNALQKLKTPYTQSDLNMLKGLIYPAVEKNGGYTHIKGIPRIQMKHLMLLMKELMAVNLAYSNLGAVTGGFDFAGTIAKIWAGDPWTIAKSSLYVGSWVLAIGVPAFRQYQEYQMVKEQANLQGGPALVFLQEEGGDETKSEAVESSNFAVNGCSSLWGKIKDCCPSKSEPTILRL